MTVENVTVASLPGCLICVGADAEGIGAFVESNVNDIRAGFSGDDSTLTPVLRLFGRDSKRTLTLGSEPIGFCSSGRSAGLEGIPNLAVRLKQLRGIANRVTNSYSRVETPYNSVLANPQRNRLQGPNMCAIPQLRGREEPRALAPDRTTLALRHVFILPIADGLACVGP